MYYRSPAFDTDEPDNGSKKKSKEWDVSNVPLRENNV